METATVDRPAAEMSGGTVAGSRRNSTNPLLLFRVGYMEAYDGRGKIVNGGSHIDENGEGGEMWNFRVEGGRCYGYVMSRHFAGIDLGRLDSTVRWDKGDELENVDIVFIARRPGVGQVVVGWYKNATVYHRQYRTRRGSKKAGDWSQLQFLCHVDAENATLLDEKDRTFEVPYAPVHGKGLPGHANVWYAEGKNPAARDFLKRLRQYVGLNGQGSKSKLRSKPSGTGRGIPDKELIARIEQAAVDAAWNHYERLGYAVQTFETDNRGWDLEASKGEEILLLEVKGHLGNVIQFELTPNEYSKMQEYHPRYKVCVVRQALDSPDLVVFVPKRQDSGWQLVAETGTETVSLMEKTAARACGAD